MQEIYNKLITRINKDMVLQNEPMSKHTTFKIGGPADLFVRVANVEELKFVLSIAKENKINYYIIGNGSNILVKDKGIRGIVIQLNMNEICVSENKIKAFSGALLSKICLTAKENELSGLEFAYGIPGTVGGAVMMNAGAYGGEMKDVILETTYLDENLEIKTINNDEQEFKYRESIFKNKNWIILSTTLLLKKGNKSDIEEQMAQNMLSRKQKQPVEYPSAGSTFKRGNDFITAKLIDDAGLKGKQIGGAMVSTKHAGFIINKECASAKDVLDLVYEIKNQIKIKFNKDIELEMLILGE